MNAVRASMSVDLSNDARSALGRSADGRRRGGWNGRRGGRFGWNARAEYIWTLDVQMYIPMGRSRRYSGGQTPSGSVRT